jgi:hypothetical protein
MVMSVPMLALTASVINPQGDQPFRLSIKI